MTEPLRILHLEDEPLDTELAVEQLKSDGVRAIIDRVETLSQLQQALSSDQYQLVLSDYTLPDTDPLEALRLVRERNPELPFIFLSGTIGEERATQALKLGANDYVLKQKMEQLVPVIRRALGEAQEQARRKQAEEALRRSEARLRLAQEVARIGTFEWDMTTGQSTWSPEMEALHGLKPGTFPGRYETWRELVHPEDLAAVESLLQNAAKAGGFEGEWRVIWPDGTMRWLAARGHVFSDASGKPVRMIGVNIDITERKHAEEDLRAATLSAERAKETAEEANRAKDRFLAILSHELRTPLTAVLPALEALEPMVPEQAREYLEMASRNVELEARLIDDLLDITRIARGKIELHRVAVDICSVVRQAAEVCHSDIEARGLHFKILTDAPPHMVDADPARLQQVFWNLIQNAVKFTPSGGCIGVRASTAGDRSIVEVHDSGTGIDAQAMDRIFNAFEQEGKTTTRKFGGLGLGLAICRVLVEMHGGNIRASSNGKGMGASFVVELPLVFDHLPAAEPSQQPAAPSAASQPTRRRILLVEDHADTAKIIAILLRRAGHQVQHAPDMNSALKMAEENSYDLLLSDLGLPDGSGVSLMMELRSRGLSIPGIAFSGYGQEDDLRRSAEAGFAQHLVKPVNNERLLSAIAEVGRLAGSA